MTGMQALSAIQTAFFNKIPVVCGKMQQVCAIFGKKALSNVKTFYCINQISATDAGAQLDKLAMQHKVSSRVMCGSAAC